MLLHISDSNPRIYSSTAYNAGLVYIKKYTIKTLTTKRIDTLNYCWKRQPFPGAEEPVGDKLTFLAVGIRKNVSDTLIGVLCGGDGRKRWAGNSNYGK